MTKFAQVLDSANGLAIEEQESLVEVLQHRLAEHRRAELAEAVKSARRQFKNSRVRPAMPAQIVKRLFTQSVLTSSPRFHRDLQRITAAGALQLHPRAKRGGK